NRAGAAVQAHAQLVAVRREALHHLARSAGAKRLQGGQRIPALAQRAVVLLDLIGGSGARPAGHARCELGRQLLRAEGEGEPGRWRWGRSWSWRRRWSRLRAWAGRRGRAGGEQIGDGVPARVVARQGGKAP